MNSLGVLVFDAELRLVTTSELLHSFLPSIAHRFAPGSDWSEIRQILPDKNGPVDLSAVFGTASLFARMERLIGGGVLLSIQDVADQNWDEPGLSGFAKGDIIGTWEWQFDTGEMRVNERWFTMLGHTRATFGPTTLHMWEELLHPQDRIMLSSWFTGQASRPTDTFDVSFRLRHVNGTWVWVQSRGRILSRAPDGTPASMAGVHLDITAQKTFEHQLEQVLQGAQVGTWQFDEIAQTNTINARWAEMLGYTLEEITCRPGHYFLDLLHPDDRSKIIAEKDGRTRDGLWVFDNECRLRHKDGHWVWVLSRGQVTEWSPDGVPLHSSGVHIDISERKELAEALARERDLLAGLMETSVSGIMAFDAEGRIVFVNRETETVMGRPAAVLIGKTCDDPELGLTDPQGTPLGPNTLPCSVTMNLGMAQREVKVLLHRPDGTQRHLLINAAPMRQAGLSARVVSAVLDVTDAVEAEAALRAAMERAEAGNRAKSVFLANMSHEIRTPLNGVLGMADVLASMLTEPVHRQMLQTIQQSGTHLLEILNDLLDLAKIESGQVKLEQTVFSPADVVRRIEALHGVAARDKGIALQVLCDEAAAQTRMGDTKRLVQILDNLVGNAIKFTPAGSVHLRLATGQDDLLVIEITDTGIGMTAAQTEAVFQDFVQADETITRRFGGTGLGLPIVRNIVMLMGGTIRLNSTPGAGTQVRVELPMPPAPEPPASPRHPVQNLMQLRALVAEDNGTNRIILRTMLVALGVQATLVEDGEQALMAWTPHDFDILLLDISMPLRDGISALHAIKARALATGVACPPALAVTANAMAQHVTEYIDAGFAGVVTKPLRLQELATAIADAVNQHLSD